MGENVIFAQEKSMKAIEPTDPVDEIAVSAEPVLSNINSGICGGDNKLIKQTVYTTWKVRAIACTKNQVFDTTVQVREKV